MLCDKCKQRQATYHSSVNINGNVSESHLCSECAMSENKINNGFSSGAFFDIPMSDIKSEILNSNNSAQNFSQNENLENETKCNFCGSTFQNFLDSGLLSCANCYTTFKTQLEPVISSMQWGLKHVGKTLQNNENLSEHEKEIKSLEFKLKQAVALENYELASQLKKKINDLRMEEN